MAPGQLPVTAPAAPEAPLDRPLEARLRFALGVTTDWLKFGEAKNAALVAFNGALAAAAVNVLGSDKPPLAHVPRWYTGALLACVVASVVVGVVSLLPQTHIPWVRRRAAVATRDNLLFFGHVANYTAADYARAMADALGLAGYTANRVEGALAEQVVVNATIASRKYTYFRYAAWLTLAGVVTPLGALLVALLFPGDRDR